MKADVLHAPVRYASDRACRYMKRWKARKLICWLTWGSIWIVIISVICCSLLEGLGRLLMRDAYSALFSMTGMAIPVGLVVGFASSRIFKAIYKHVTVLLEGIERVAGGNFNTRLNVKKAGPIPEVYENFNKMTEELRSVQTLRRDFANRFSHEFKTPITSIQGFASLLLETEVNEAERRTYLTIIAEEAGRLAELSQNTLLLSKLDAQTLIPDQVAYALDEQIKRCAILLSPDWNQKHIEFSADLPPVTYIGNEEMGQHVWLNMLSNAIRFTPSYGEIHVAMHTTKEWVIVSIADTGIGMTPEQINHIFDEYYQADTAHSGRGLGLGLSIVQRIVQLMGGTIDVQSAPNEGSVFTVTLPLVAPVQESR